MKLGLSEKEIMERPWILTQIESADFPWFSSKKEKTIMIRTQEDGEKYLGSIMSKNNNI
jgi:hypothetical protein